MTALATALRDICRILTELRVPFALIGGLAVSARSEPRFTRDIDLAVAVSANAVDSLGRSLVARGLEIDALPVFSVRRDKVLGFANEVWLSIGASVHGDPGANVVPPGRTVGSAGETAVEIVVKPGTSEGVTAHRVFG